MRQADTTIAVATHGQGLYEISDPVRRWTGAQGIGRGLLTLFCLHTSASLVIQENADPDVRRDLQAFFARLVREGDPLFRHMAEGPDDMPAHVRAALTQTQLSIPVLDGMPCLGTWQGIFLFEHRRAPHAREVVLHLIGG